MSEHYFQCRGNVCLPLGVIYSFILSECGPGIILHARVCVQFRLDDVPMKCTQLRPPKAKTRLFSLLFFYDVPQFALPEVLSCLIPRWKFNPRMGAGEM